MSRGARRRGFATSAFAVLLVSLAASALYRSSVEHHSVDAACRTVAGLGPLPLPESWSIPVVELWPCDDADNSGGGSGVSTLASHVAARVERASGERAPASRGPCVPAHLTVLGLEHAEWGSWLDALAAAPRGALPSAAVALLRVCPVHGARPGRAHVSPSGVVFAASPPAVCGTSGAAESGAPAAAVGKGKDDSINSGTNEALLVRSLETALGAVVLGGGLEGALPDAFSTRAAPAEWAPEVLRADGEQGEGSVAAQWLALRARDAGTWAATHAGLRLQVSIVEGEPGAGSDVAAAAAWDSAVAVAPALVPLVAAARRVVDVDVAPAARLAYAHLADPSVLAPTLLVGGALAFVVPHWARRAVQGVSGDLPLHSGASDVLAAYGLSWGADAGGGAAATESGTGAGGADTDASTAALLAAVTWQAHPFLPWGAKLTSASTARRSDNSSSGNEGLCVCQLSPLSEWDGSASAGVDDGSLGRSAGSLLREFHAWLARPSAVPPCAPKNLLRCSGACGGDGRGSGGGSSSGSGGSSGSGSGGGGSSGGGSSTTNSDRWVCVAHRGWEVVHAAGYVPPAPIAPLYFEAAPTGAHASAAEQQRPGSGVAPSPRSASSSVAFEGGGEGVTTLEVRGWGAWHVLNGSPPSSESGAQSSGSGGFVLDVTRQLRRTLGLSNTPPCGFDGAEPLACDATPVPAAPAPWEQRLLARRWLRVHWARAREALAGGLCALSADGDGRTQLRVPRAVRASADAAAELLARVPRAVQRLLDVDSPVAGDAADGALALVRLARYHADATAADALVSRDSALGLSHLAAIYAPWWAPLLLPLIFAVMGALRKPPAKVDRGGNSAPKAPRLGVRVVALDPRCAAHAQAFKDINEEWIKHFFVLEPHDVQTLSDPAALVAAGGRIFVALDGVAVPAQDASSSSSDGGHSGSSTDAADASSDAPCAASVLGVCALLVPAADGGEGVELAKMGVRDGLRGRGVGRALLAAALAYARAAHVPRIDVLSNRRLKAALALYTDVGFIEKPMPPNDYDRADIYMELKLSSDLQTPRR